MDAPFIITKYDPTYSGTKKLTNVAISSFFEKFEK